MQSLLLQEIAFAATAMAQAHDWRDGIDDLLARLGRTVGASRVYLFELGRTAEGLLTHTCLHDWAGPGLERLAGASRYTHEIIENYDPVFDTWITRRRRGEVIQGHTRDLEGALRLDFDYQKIKSFMSAPIHVDGHWWGHLGFDDCVEERNWSSDEVHLLQTTAALIGASIVRDGATQTAERSAALRAAMLDVALDAIIILDDRGLVKEFNRAAEAIFGWARDEVVGLPISDIIVPARLRAAHAAGFRAATAARRLARPQTRSELTALRSDGVEFPVELALAQIDQGQGIVYAAFIRDLTDRHAVEKQMRVVERDKANLARFFSPRLVEHMIAIDTPLSVNRYQQATILFVDMIGFTKYCAENTPAMVISMLRELLALLSQQVFDHQGTIDKFLGDGLLAVFGSPTPGPLDATNALACGQGMLKMVAEWNRRKGRPADAAIEVAVGIHTGEVILGDIGSEARLEFTVLGDTVNIASRVEGKCRSLGMAMLVTSAVMDAVSNECSGEVPTSFHDLSFQTLRGLAAPLRLFGIPRTKAKAAVEMEG